jgi:hypothetical protein
MGDPLKGVLRHFDTPCGDMKQTRPLPHPRLLRLQEALTGGTRADMLHDGTLILWTQGLIQKIVTRVLVKFTGHYAPLIRMLPPAHKRFALF